MCKIETFYLVDYENVNTDGFVGCEKLDKSDCIVIFFTQNAKMLDMSKISNRGESKIDLFEVPAGKQSADIHIMSYLGYLIGKNEEKEKEFNIVILSKDSDFDNVINFWHSKNNVKISRRPQIKLSAAKTETKTKNLQKKNSARKSSSSTSTSNANSNKEKINKISVNSDIMKLLSKAGYKNEIVAYVASTVAKNLGVKNGRQQTYRTIISKYGQSEGLAIYSLIKTHI